MMVATDISLDTIIAKLRALEPQISAHDVTRLAIFGSRVRGDHRPDSDLDILIEHNPSAGKPFASDFFNVMHLIEDSIGVWPHLMTLDELTPRIIERMADDVTEVF